MQDLHPREVTPAQARAIQERLRTEVIRNDLLGPVRWVAGADVGFDLQRSRTCAAIAVLQFPELELHETVVAYRSITFPYIPGLLSFREIPALLDALAKLQRQPDLLLCDGQGIAHPRRLGIASHLGVLTDLPTIGVAKKRLLGVHAAVPETKGSWEPLYENDEMIGAVLRTRDRVKPLYISIGHKISLPTAIAYVMRCLTRYRLPETTRQAHRLASGLAGSLRM